MAAVSAHHAERTEIAEGEGMTTGENRGYDSNLKFSFIISFRDPPMGDLDNSRIAICSQLRRCQASKGGLPP
ncbi:hypothetical protein SKAU_G00353340 [Synaphobranchus kaupii]|uniref:Uncharacterized protein n=1 Tax=Synaphobranchus kaupii TaxID=118154 RepID=A0A9Q1EKX7_SYNKA|nr:hypothetical protein SKAU_G00353340 [Synaphobranchus kaupii]